MFKQLKKTFNSTFNPAYEPTVEEKVAEKIDRHVNMLIDDFINYEWYRQTIKARINTIEKLNKFRASGYTDFSALDSHE